MKGHCLSVIENDLKYGLPGQIGIEERQQYLETYPEPGRISFSGNIKWKGNLHPMRAYTTIYVTSQFDGLVVLF